MVPRLYRSVCAIIFFGAPHRGLNNPELEQAVRGTPPDDLVRDLRPDSSLLSSLNNSFPNACEDIKIISCYETEHTRTYEAKNRSDPNSKWEKTGPPRFMVPPSSACLDWPRAKETKVAIPTDHSEIAKLSDNIGRAYHQIKNEIEQILKNAPEFARRRREMDLAPQNTLNLLLILQFEYFWLSAWCCHRSGEPPRHGYSAEVLNNGLDLISLSELPYGHPAYLIVNNVNLILGLLSALLRKYRLNPLSQDNSSQDQPTEVGMGPFSQPKNLSIAPIQLSFTTQHTHGHLAAERGQYGDVYDVEHWSKSDQEQLRYLLSKFCHENGRLSQLSRHATSFDLMASSQQIYSKFA